MNYEPDKISYLITGIIFVLIGTLSFMLVLDLIVRITFVFKK